MTRALLVLGLLAAAYYQSGPLFFVLGVALLLSLAAHMWLRETTGHLLVSRTLERRLFYGEQTTVRLTFANSGVLPIPWIEASESLPVALRQVERCSEVLALGPGQRRTMSYVLVGRRRGLHGVGPLTLSVGDVFGLARHDLSVPDPEYLLVYPRILAAGELELPSLALFGDIRTRRRMLGDPARIGGIREYQPGDPLHDIHWRATAAAGSLQVKQYEPSTTVQTTVYLDLGRESYRGANVYEATELAISVAATVAQRLVQIRQEVGLVTNGVLPWSADVATLHGNAGDETLLTTISGTSHARTSVTQEGTAVVPSPLPPARGRAQLMRILEMLARLESTDGALATSALRSTGLNLPWGSTMVIVTGAAGVELLASLHRLRESGLLLVLLLVSRQAVLPEVEALARSYGVRMQSVWTDASSLVLTA